MRETALNGEYTAQPPALRVANVFFALATSGGTLALILAVATTADAAPQVNSGINPVTRDYSTPGSMPKPSTPIAPAEPLQPITAQPLRAMETKLEPEQKPEPEHRASSRRLEARNAYAMSRRTGYGSTTMGPDRYRPE